MNRRVLTVGIMLMVLIGIGIMIFPIISSLYADQNHTEAIRQYDTSVSGLPDPEIKTAREKAMSYNESLRQLVSIENPFSDDFKSQNTDYYEMLNIRGDGIMGYVSIPTIDVSLPIYHGTDDLQLSKGAGHLINSSLPVGGLSTNAVISAHTAYTKSTMFDRLTEVEVGDIFYLHVLDEVLVYEVELSEVVLPHETDLFRIVDGKDLATLVTCYPYGVNTHRLIVRGVRTDYVEDMETVIEQIQSGGNRADLRPYMMLGLLFLALTSAMITIKIDKKSRRRPDEI